MNSIHSKDAPAAIGPYSQAVVVPAGGQLVFCSGQIPLDPETGTLVQGDAATQTRQVMNNLSAVLTAAGCTFSDVARTTIYLANMDDFSAVNEAYGAFLGDHRPARATVEVSRLPKSVAVEIDAIAVRPARESA